MLLYPGIELIVVNYQTPGDLDEFMWSYVKAKIEIPHTLHVVNVEPTSADSDLVHGWAKDVRFLYTQHEDNIGYGRACNHAALYPDREVVAFFNADTRLTPGVVEGCYGALMSNDTWGVLGPRQVNRMGRITAAGVYGTLETPTFDGRWNVVDRGQYDDVRDDCVNVSGSAYFVRRSVWDELTNCPGFMDCPEVAALRPIGAFLPTKHYYNETYTSYHAIAHGYKVVYYGPERMYHEWHKASPVGGYGEKTLKESLELFRTACDFHGIAHE